MNKSYLNKLEYNKILKILEGYCHTYIGKQKVLELEPSASKEVVARTLSETAQAVSLIERNGTPPISEIEDIRVYIKMLESSNTLTAKVLLDICNILNMAEELKSFFSNFIDDESYEFLRVYFDSLYTNSGIVDKIKKSIIDSETIADNASSSLSSIRRHIRQEEQEIKNKLNIDEYDIRLALDSLKDVLSIYDPIFSDQGDTIYLCDQISDDKNKEQLKDNLLSLKEALKSIKKRERQVIEERYILGMTQAEIASHLNISQAQVSRIEKSAILALKKYAA